VDGTSFICNQEGTGEYPGLVFRADRAIDEMFELYQVLPDASNLRKFSIPLEIDDDVTNFAVSPLGGLVAFTVQLNDVNGTTGEAPSTTDAEKEQVIKAVTEAVGDRA
jgi:hypothetical protein